MATILAISSHVARGGVGLAATVPALHGLGHEVWALPTVLMASRPGLGEPARHETAPDHLAAMLAALDADGSWASLDAVLTGYFPSAASVAVAARAVRRIRQAAPGIPVLVDPILGDAGRLYVAETTAAAIREELLPLATVATPNLFELSWLAEIRAPPADSAGVAHAARSLAVPTVVVTSALETGDSIATLLVTELDAVERRIARRDGIPNGAGDVLAGLLLGYSLNGAEMGPALEAALADLDRVLATSAGREALRLAPLSRGRRE